MNKIDIKSQFIPSGYEKKVFFIDDRPFYEYMEKWIDLNQELSKSIRPIDDLEICWTDEYDNEGDARFMRFILNQEQVITPILSCPDDFDFSCIVIVVEVEKQKDKVLWKRIGKIDHSAESFEEEKSKGILYIESYSEEDWRCFGDNIALEEVGSPKWCEWISNNWSEELYRRRINYTYPYYQNENNIEWFAICDFEFDRREYDALIAKCYEDIK